MGEPAGSQGFGAGFPPTRCRGPGGRIQSSPDPDRDRGSDHVELHLADAPGNVALSRRQSRLARDSVINVSQLITLDRSYLTERARPTGHGFPGRLGSRLHHEDLLDFELRFGSFFESLLGSC